MVLDQFKNRPATAEFNIITVRAQT
jgi:hypothetical protein